ncbi:hypothetical protein [Streptomyces mirabilis]|uniref:hypothetical protein n=1 Tax=Streptomyces mirabilis TaxID=68239 RepID=UPI0033AAEE82
MSLDTTIPGAAPRGFDAFLREWERKIGDGFPQPTYSPAAIGDFRVRARATRVSDVAITDVHGASAIRSAGTPGGMEGQVRLYVVGRGAWTLGGPPDRGEGRRPWERDELTVAERVLSG